MMTELTELESDFFSALLAEDELGSVVRAHLYIEAQLSRFLELSVVTPENLCHLRINYSSKVDLACCLGFDSQFRPALKKIGKLRNDFAHDLSTKLTRRATLDLFNSLSSFGQEGVRASAKMLHEQAKLSKPPKRFNLLSPKLQFILIALNLERICFASCDLLRTAKGSSVR